MKTRWIIGSKCPECGQNFESEFMRLCTKCGHKPKRFGGYLDLHGTSIKQEWRPIPFTFGILGRWRTIQDA